MDPKEGGHFSLRPGAGPKSLELREDLGQGPLVVPPYRCACLGKTGSTSFPGRGGHHELGALGYLDFPRRCPVGTGLAAWKQRSLQCNLIFSLMAPSGTPGPSAGDHMCPSPGRQWDRVQRAWVLSQLCPLS